MQSIVMLESMNVRVAKITEELYILRLDDDRKRYFEGIWRITEGVTYNSYVLLTREGAVVFDTWDVQYADLFIDTLQRVVDLRDVKILVTHHSEPDHSGAVPRLLERRGRELRVLGHPMAGEILKHFYGVRDMNFVPVKDNDLLSVGGYTLRFIHTPMLHWPDTIMTYIPQLGVLLTCDAFGSFSTPEGIFDDELKNMDEYLAATREYAVSIVGKYREFIAKAVDKLRGLGVSPRIVAPAHGVVWRTRPEFIIDYYCKISDGSLLDARKVLILYCSMYGLKNNIVEELSKRLRDEGYNTVLLKFSYDEHAPPGRVLGELFDSALVIVITSTYEGGLYPPLMHILDLVKVKVRLPKKTVGVISYGWTSPRDLFERALREAGLDVVDIIDFRGQGTAEIVERTLRSVSRALSS